MQAIKKKLFIFIVIVSALLVSSYILFIKPRKLNIILITMDATRADHLGCYGYLRKTSPNIDKIAREGLIFDNAFSQAPWTAPSVTSIMTSLYPIQHKVDSWSKIPSMDLETLPKILKFKGYNVFAICPEFLIRLAKDLGFYNIISAEPAEEVTKDAVKLLNNKAPFFIWIHYFDPHSPYTPPKPFDSLFFNDDIYLKQNLKIPLKPKEYRNDNEIKYLGENGIPANAQIDSIMDTNFYVSRYDGEIAYVDSQIGVLFKEIKTRKLDKNTLIIISADHGEMMGEHGVYFTHSKYLFDDLIRVPLIFRYPGISFNGVRIKRLVQSIDIFPTILSILRIKYPNKIQGVNLFSLFGLIKERIFGKYIYSSETIYNGISTVSIRGDKWKAVYPYKRNCLFSITLKELLDTLKLSVVNEESLRKIVKAGTVNFNNLNYILNVVKSQKDEKIFIWFHYFSKSRFIPFPANYMYLKDKKITSP